MSWFLRIAAITFLTPCLIGSTRVGAETVVSALLLHDQFRTAAQEFALPVELLEAVAFVETGWRPQAQEVSEGSVESQDDHGPSSFGVMGLREDGSSRSIQIAAALIGRTVEELKTSSLQNIRGAAAILGKLAREEKLTAWIDSKNLRSWMQVIGKFSGLEAFKIDEATGKLVPNLIEQSRQQATYSEGILLVLQKGFEVDQVLVPSLAASDSLMSASIQETLTFLRSNISFLTPLEQLTAKLGKVTDVDFPEARFKRSPWVKAGGPAKKYIVIHSTEGDYASAINHLTSQRNRLRTSAHYVIRSVDGLVTQLIKNEDRATHACGRNQDKEYWNDVAIGIEHEGRAAERNWQTEQLYKSSARLVSYLMKTFAIPIENIISHADAYQVQKKYNGGGCDYRSDPGSGWDWNYYRDLVQLFSHPLF